MTQDLGFRLMDHILGEYERRFPSAPHTGGCFLPEIHPVMCVLYSFIGGNTSFNNALEYLKARNIPPDMIQRFKESEMSGLRIQPEWEQPVEDAARKLWPNATPEQIKTAADEWREAADRYKRERGK